MIFGILVMGADILVLGKAFDSEREIDPDFAGCGNDNFFHFGGEAVVPGFEFVGAGRNILDAVTAGFIG